MTYSNNRFDTIEIVHIAVEHDTLFSRPQQQDSDAQNHVVVRPVENSCAAIQSVFTSSVGVQADAEANSVGVQAGFTQVSSVAIQASTEANNVGVQAESEADDVGIQTPMANRLPPVLGLQSAPVLNLK